MTALTASWKRTVASSSGQRITIAVLQGLSLVVLLAGMAPREFAFLNLAYWGARLPQPIISFGLSVAAQRFVAELEPENQAEEAARASTLLFILSTLNRLHLGFSGLVFALWAVLRFFFTPPFGTLALFLAICALQALVISRETFLFQGFQSLNEPNRAVMYGGLIRAVSVFAALVVAMVGTSGGYNAYGYAYLAGLGVAQLAMIGSVRYLHQMRGAAATAAVLARRDLLRYGTRLTAIRIVNELRNMPESFVVAGVFGLELSGILGGYRRLSASLQTVVVSLGIMTGTYTSNLMGRDRSSLQRILASLVAAASGVALVGFIVTVGIGPFLFDRIFPDEFSTELPYLYLMVGLVFGQAVAGNAKAVLEVLGDTRCVFVLQMSFIAAYWVLLIIGWRMRSPLIMIVAPGLTTMAESLAYAAVARNKYDLQVRLSPRLILEALVARRVAI